MTLVFLDDDIAREFEPFALTRPVSELRAGAELIRRRWEIALGLSSSGIIAADHLADFEENGAPPVRRDELAAGTVVVNARCAISLERADADADAWRCDGRLAALRLRASCPAASVEARFEEWEESPTGTIADVGGWWLDAVWDLVRHLTDMMSADIPLLGATLATEAGGALTRVGAYPVFVDESAAIDPYVVLDATAGPILVRRGAAIHAFSRIVGPCVIGEDTVVNGGRIAASSIGETCRVHGELNSTIFVGHANKSHDGFIGHSVLGRWVNLGASTVNSNLKNTYGSVSLWTPSGIKQTGMQFLGTFFGDHAKTAIGTRLTTGCVVGAGANLVGGTAAKVVPPFAWGMDGAQVFALDRFLVTAERMMARRHVTLGERARRQLSAAHAQRWKVEE
jgi:UDP-N-acetylglucosamine diphosphorylase/glucosamine-1-phosphate N-acetyltransferase